jgi:glycosyltransferase involved in cell wall biosynthesis
MLRWFAPHWDRIDIICPRPAGPPSLSELYGNVFLHPSPWPTALQPFFILKAGRALFRERAYDLVVSHDFGFFYNGLGAWLLTGGSGVPYISELHHIEGYPFALTRRELLSRYAARLYVNFAKRWALAFRVVNRAEMPGLLREWGVGEGKILYLPSQFLDFEIFTPHPPEEKRYDLLFVGRFSPNKAVPTILEALALLKPDYPQIKLGLLGSGPAEGVIREKIGALGLGEQVEFIPRAAGLADLARVYKRARMLVCASTSEGGPRVTVEAMACGVPVLSTPVGVMKDLLEQDGESFLAFAWHAGPLSEAARLILENPRLGAQVGENGRRAVAGFSAERVIGNYARAYQAAVGAFRSRSS